MNVTKIFGEGYRIGIPVPFPMKYVYCYLFPQEDRYVVIDTGLNYSKAREAWDSVFFELEIEPAQVRDIYITHFHPDHSGLAGWMQEKTGANVYMHQEDLDMMLRVWGEDSIQADAIENMVIDYGTPAELSEEIKENMKQLTPRVRPLPDMKVIPKKPMFAGREWEVLHTPGHSDGLISFYDSDEQILISSDLILDPITPNISLWPGASEKPLHDYIASLSRVRELPVRTAYSAHGDPILHVKERIDKLIAHHEERLSTIEDLAPGKNAYDIALLLFKHRELNSHQWRFAMAETIAHLAYLEDEGRLKKQKDSSGTYHFHGNHQII